jgi:hypothetical protein
VARGTVGFLRALYDLIKGGVDTVKNILGIRSPSRVAEHEIMGNFMEGLFRRIRRDKPRLASEMRRLVGEARRAAEDEAKREHRFGARLALEPRIERELARRRRYETPLAGLPRPVRDRLREAERMAARALLKAEGRARIEVVVDAKGPHADKVPTRQLAAQIYAMMEDQVEGGR